LPLGRVSLNRPTGIASPNGASTEVSTSSRGTGRPLIRTTPSTTWTLSPGRPISRLITSVRPSLGFLNTTMSPRAGAWPSSRPCGSGGLSGIECRLQP
jgi:hypothetical protein